MDSRQTQISIKKIDEDRQIVFGEVYAPYRVDTYGEFMLPEDIEKMAHRFMRLDMSEVIDTNHDETPNGSYPIESFVARDGDPDFTPGAWVLGVKVEDAAVWDRVISGDLNGFSFQSMVRAIPVEIEIEVSRFEVGMTEPDKADGHQHVYVVEFDDRGRVIRGWTSEMNGHKHVIKHGTATEKSGEWAGHRFFVGE